LIFFFSGYVPGPIYATCNNGVFTPQICKQLSVQGNPSSTLPPGVHDGSPYTMLYIGQVNIAQVAGYAHSFQFFVSDVLSTSQAFYVQTW
jgi:hypothetical protein